IATVLPFTLPVLPVANRSAARRPFPVGGDGGVPLATTIVQSGWPAVALVVIGLPLLVLQRRRPKVRPVAATLPGDPELELRQLLGPPLDAGPDRVAAALRRRGIAREDAEHIRRWLSAVGRRRYGPSQAEAPTPPPAMTQVLGMLRRGFTPVLLLLLA